MEFAAAALTAVAGGISSAVSAVGSGVASVVGGAGTAAGGAGTAASLLASPSMGTLTLGLPSLGGGASLLTGLLSGGATIASMMGQMRQADSQADGLMAAAQDTGLEMQIEATRGIERRDTLKRALLERLGQQDVAAAASGVDLSFGTPALARDESQRDAERALGIDQATEDLRASRLRERAGELRIAAAGQRKAGRTRALATGLTGITKLLERG